MGIEDGIFDTHRIACLTDISNCLCLDNEVVIKFRALKIAVVSAKISQRNDGVQTCFTGTRHASSLNDL